MAFPTAIITAMGIKDQKKTVGEKAAPYRPSLRKCKRKKDERRTTVKRDSLSNPVCPFSHTKHQSPTFSISKSETNKKALASISKRSGSIAITRERHPDRKSVV